MPDPAKKSFVVAIDGPSAAGKGTLSRRIAARYGLAFLDTGLIYRAVAARTLADGRKPEDPAAAQAAARAIVPADLGRGDLRAEKVAQAASVVAAHPGVRKALVEFQRRFAAEPPPLADGSPASGEYVYVKPGVPAHAVRLPVDAEDTELAERFAGALRAVLAVWQRGSFFPRLVDGSQDEPRACTWCDVREACWRGDSGARRRLADWAAAPADSATEAEQALRLAWELRA